MIVKLFRSLWGIYKSDAQLFSLLKTLRDSGYHGIECSLSDMGKDKSSRNNMRNLCDQLGLERIIGIYSAWDDYEGPVNSLYSPVNVHLENFKSQLHEALEYGAVHVNGHSGSDSWSEDESICFFRSASLISKELGAHISHETHRGRALHNPWLTKRIVSAVPDLRLTADLSHWVLSCERNFSSTYEMKVLQDLAPFVDHVHARIGTPQCPQVPQPASPEYAVDRTMHESWWKMVRDEHVKVGKSSLTITPEYGPYPYGGKNQYGSIWDTVNREGQAIKHLLSQ